MEKIDFERIKKIATKAGAQKWAIQKWKQRGIPVSWQVEIIKAHPGEFTFRQFDSFNSDISKGK